MSGLLSLRAATQTQVDMRRITNELADLQRQMASGAVSNDLRGFGGASSRLLNARSLKASADARGSVINQLQARFGVQGAALSQVAGAAGSLSQSIREAISANDGRGIGVELELSFASIVAALNESWNGQPLFAGERQGIGPIKVDTLDELAASAGPQDLFDEAERHQTLDLGAGQPIVLGDKASELSQGLFDALKELKLMLDSAGGTIGQPISATQRTQLLHVVDQLEAESTRFTSEEGRAGQLQKRFEGELVRLQERSNLITKEIGDQADADLEEVSVRLSALMLQYQASAKIYSEISQLSLLNFLPATG